MYLHTIHFSTSDKSSNTVADTFLLLKRFAASTTLAIGLALPALAETQEPTGYAVSISAQQDTQPEAQQPEKSDEEIRADISLERLTGDPIPEWFKNAQRYSSTQHMLLPSGSRHYTDGSSDVPSWNSNPDSVKVFYIDFDGGDVGGYWANKYNDGNVIRTLSFSLDGDHSYFTAEEIQYMKIVWKGVSEDYSPFDVNITTDLAVYEAANVHQRVRLMFTPTCDFINCAYLGYSGSGFAYTRLDKPDPGYSPCFAWAGSLDPYRAASITSHEFGHVMGLAHDGNATKSYHRGDEGWGPIMGLPFYTRYATWSKGEYPGANNPQDDFAQIASKLGYRADETTRHGAGTHTGVIGSGDSDDFTVTVAAGDTIFVNANVAEDTLHNLKPRIRLFAPNGTLVATQNPDHYSVNVELPSTTLSYTALNGGTYRARIDGTGSSTPYSYSRYGSAGQYEVNVAINLQEEDLPTNAGPFQKDPSDSVKITQAIEHTDSAAHTRKVVNPFGN